MTLAVICAHATCAQTDSGPETTPTPGARALVFPDALGNPVEIAPTAYLRPDVQVIWEPASNADLGNSVVFQLPLVTTR